MKLQALAGLAAALVFACIPLRAHAQSAAGEMGSAATGTAKQAGETPRTDDAEHGLGHDGVAVRHRFARASAVNGGRDADAVDALDAGCAVGPFSVGRSVGAGCTIGAGCPIGTVDAGRTAGCGLLAEEVFQISVERRPVMPAERGAY